MDDIFIACHPNNITNILDKFNKYHEKLKFTYEIEKDSKLAFLDVLVRRSNIDGSLMTAWYTKTTWTQRYLNFLSNAPLKNKIAVIYGLVDRAILLSDKKFHYEAINKVISTLKLNNYPTNFINKFVKKRKITLKNRKNNKTALSDNINNKFIIIPFIEKISPKIKSLIKSKMNVKVCYSKSNTLSSVYTKLKSKIPNELQSNVIYKIDCNNCDKTYIGQTRNYLRDRLNSHKRSIQKSSNETALSKHAINNGHTFNTENTKIMTHESNNKKRLFKEMIFIKKTPNTINYNEDINGLSTLYSGIISLTITNTKEMHVNMVACITILVHPTTSNKYLRSLSS